MRPGDARFRDDATGRREPVGLGRRVEVPPAGAGADAWPGARSGSTATLAIADRSIDQRAVADRQARDVVAAAADRDGQALRPSQRDGRDHLVRRLDAGDDRRTVVDHAVPDLAGLVVAGVVRSEQALGGDRRGRARRRRSRPSWASSAGRPPRVVRRRGTIPTGRYGTNADAIAVKASFRVAISTRPNGLLGLPPCPETAPPRANGSSTSRPTSPWIAASRRPRSTRSSASPASPRARSTTTSTRRPTSAGPSSTDTRRPTSRRSTACGPRREQLSRDPLQQLLLFVGLFANLDELATDDPGCLYATFIYERQLGVDGAIDVIDASIRAWRDRFRAKLDEVVERYPPRLDVDLDALSDLVFSTSEGAYIVARATRDPALVRGQLLQVRAYLELLVRSPDPAPPIRARDGVPFPPDLPVRHG